MENIFIDDKTREELLRQYQSLNLSDDFLFSVVMSDEEICRELIEEILNVKIEKIIYNEEQKALKAFEKGKGVRFDAYVCDDKGTIYNVEMQAANTKDLDRRSRYYQGNIDTDILKTGGLYKDLKECYVIFICCFDMFGKDSYKYTFKNYCEEHRNLCLNDGAVKVFLNTRGKKGAISESLKSFLKYVENSTDETADKSSSHLVKTIHNKVKQAKINEELGASYMTAEMKERQLIAESFEKGAKWGIKQGIEQGIEKDKIETAARMINFNLPTDIISKVTGLSNEEIAGLMEITTAIANPAGRDNL